MKPLNDTVNLPQRYRVSSNNNNHKKLNRPGFAGDSITMYYDDIKFSGIAA